MDVGKGNSLSNPNDKHDEGLCERCQTFGRPSRETVGKSMGRPTTHIPAHDGRCNKHESITVFERSPQRNGPVQPKVRIIFTEH